MFRIPVRYLVGMAILLALVGMLAVGVNSVNPDRNAFAAIANLNQLESALDMYCSHKGGIPRSDDSTEILKHIHSVYGEAAAKNQKFNEIDRAELLTLLLSQKTWPIEHDSEKIFFEFDERCLFDRDNDGWLEYRFKDGRLYLIRKGEVCLWNENTNSYQFSR